MTSLAVEIALGLVEIVSSLIFEEINKKKDVKDDINSIVSCLKTMRAYLSDKGGTQGNQRHRDKVDQIRNFAYDIQNAFDEFRFCVPQSVHTQKIKKIVREVFRFPQHRLALHELSSRITKIRTQIEYFGDLEYLRTENTSSGEDWSSAMWSEDNLFRQLIEKDDILGFEDHVESISDQLLSGEPKLSTISIVGPPGSGKHVLAKQVFGCERVQGHFDCRAWVQVSRSFNLKNLLRSIFTDFFPEMDGSFPANKVPSKVTFMKYLQQKRFIVVLDDIWRTQDFELIVNELPIDSSSSILVTSCHIDVGIFCAKSLEYVHELNGLQLGEALSLFYKKAFPNCNGICPPELENLSKKIIEKCEGLPLAVIEAGKVLSRKQQIPSEWKKLHDRLRDNLPRMTKILVRSYEDLPSDQRNCFLYFSIFPEGYSVQRQRLIRLLIAEGFVKEARNTSLEEVAENYLNNLVQRNLVHVTARDIDGRVRSCRVLNLFHDFVIAKAAEENFVRSASKSSSLQGIIWRLSAQTEICANVELSETLGYVRSAFMLGSRKYLNLESFRLLKVLDMQGALLTDFPIYIVKLVLLKYLSLRETNIKTVPKSIKELCLLETLDLKQTRVTSLPGTIFGLHLLRYLLVYNYDMKNYVTSDGAEGVKMHDGTGTLSNIRKLSLVKATSELVQKLDGMIHLRKLGLVNLKSENGRKVCQYIQKMEHLSTLDVRAESGNYLELDYIRGKPAFEFLRHLYLEGQLQRLPKWISSLNSLIKVGLKGSRLNINPLQSLQDLPNLMELHMVNAFMGQTLEFEMSAFKKLKILRIEQFSELHMVAVQVGAMPALEKLTFCKCEKLKMLPLGIDLTGLQQVLLYDMNREFTNQLQKSEDRNLVDHVRVIHSCAPGLDQ